jgi:hypothetical protein
MVRSPLPVLQNSQGGEMNVDLIAARSGRSMPSEAKIRIWSLLGYLTVLVAIQYWVVDTRLLPNENTTWFFSGIASLLFGSRLLNPYFTAPADSATNGVAALLAILPAFPLVVAWTPEAYVLAVVTAYAGLVALVSILVIIIRRGRGLDQARFFRALDKSVKSLGSPNVIFSLVIVASAWLFHRDKPVEVFAILSSLVVISVIHPIEAIWIFVGWVRGLPKPIERTDIVGTVAAHQSPGIVLIRQLEATPIARGTSMVIVDRHGPPLLGIALNYVGRDEGNLLRALTAKLPPAAAGTIELPRAGEEGVAALVTIGEEDSRDVPALQWGDRLRGIVDSDTSLEYLQFEVIDERGLCEGCLVEVQIGEQPSVIYQVIEGLTREEVVQQKNKYGYARAKARKIGAWDVADSRFMPVSWLPRMNAPVLLMSSQEGDLQPDCIGHFPNTPFGIRLEVSSCVTHNTAILGILGVGKSYLAIELVERMIAAGVKVLCLDLTNQYEQLLGDFIDPAFQAAKLAELKAAGVGGLPNQDRERGGSRHTFKRAVHHQIRDFLSSDDDHFLRVINPAQFQVTKQPSFMNNQGHAELMTLTACEITSIFSDMALLVSQRLGMTDVARLCIVYEEAHSLVPEWNSVATDGDRTATSTSARAILQGRKYGLGCLLITQRTANVTKTILNQCNTIFAMRTFDDTGREFLGNYIGSDYARILPSLQPREAIVFGKASSCENPVLIRLNDADRFRAAFRPHNQPKVPAPYVVPVVEEAVAVADDEVDVPLEDNVAT